MFLRLTTAAGTWQNQLTIQIKFNEVDILPKLLHLLYRLITSRGIRNQLIAIVKSPIHGHDPQNQRVRYERRGIGSTITMIAVRHHSLQLVLTSEISLIRRKQKFSAEAEENRGAVVFVGRSSLKEILRILMEARNIRIGRRQVATTTGILKRSLILGIPREFNMTKNQDSEDLLNFNLWYLIDQLLIHLQDPEVRLLRVHQYLPHHLITLQTLCMEAEYRRLMGLIETNKAISQTAEILE